MGVILFTKCLAGKSVESDRRGDHVVSIKKGDQVQKLNRVGPRLVEIVPAKPYGCRSFGEAE